MSVQTLKSALDARVRNDQASRLSSQRQNLGEPLTCVAGAADIYFDIYGRPASQNTLPVNLDSACGELSQYNSRRQMQIETNHRPYIPICAAGLRGAGDLDGVGRDLIPQNLYGEGYRGNFIRHYRTANNAPPHDRRFCRCCPKGAPRGNVMKHWDGSHDATSHLYRG